MSQDSPEVPSPSKISDLEESPVPLVPSTTPKSSETTGLAPGRFALLLLGICLLAYLPALFGGFIWDDSGHVTRSDLRSLDGLWRIWTEPGATQQYYPLLHSAFWVESWLFGDQPFGYHLLNVLLHSCSAFLFFTLLRRLALPGAWLAALLFALHPVCVESVAWISEQKNALSLVFYLGAALLYLRFDEKRRAGPYFAASALFAAALLTKTVTASLPAALLVLFWWKRRKLSWKSEVLPLLPWFALAAAGGAMTTWMEHHFIGAEGDAFALSWAERFLVAGRAVWFYAAKLFWPADLIFIYPRWHIDSGALWQWLFPLAALAFLAVLLYARERGRAVLAAALLFGGALFPALGFINVYPFTFSFVADHFQYLASLPLFALTGAFLHTQLSRIGPAMAPLAGAALALVLGLLTAHQCLAYRDLGTLYETILKKNPSCWLAHNNLGIELLEQEEPEKALEHFLQALELRPKYPQASSNAGDALNRLGRSREALPYIEKALELEPDFADAHNNLGVCLMNLGKSEAGLGHFRKAIEIAPHSARAHLNLAQALANQGRMSEALPLFAKTVELNPADYDAQLAYAMTLCFLQRMPEAKPHFEKAVALQPDNPNTYYSYGRLLCELGLYAEAVPQLRKALQLAPDNQEALPLFARALRQSGHPEEALFVEQELRRAAPLQRR